MTQQRGIANKGEAMADVRDQIAAHFVEALKSGTIPWRKPWSGGNGRPRNFVSQKPYRGVNSLYLGLLAAANGYATGEWITLNQCLKAGGRVIREEFAKSTNVIFWKFIPKEETDANGRKVRRTIPLCRSFRVWNVAQCEGLPVREVVRPDVSPIESAEKIVAGMANPPKITHNEGDRACYIPARDEVQMPTMAQFIGGAEYYSTLFHELAHSTGHESRLKRDGIMNVERFGSESYSKEELIAEITASFLNAEAGIYEDVKDNSTAYVKNWAAKLENDPRMVIDAASAAQKAADYILGVKFTTDTTDED